MTPDGPIESWGKLVGDVLAATVMLDRFLRHVETGMSRRLTGTGLQEDRGRRLMGLTRIPGGGQS